MYFKSKKQGPQAFICVVSVRRRDYNVFADIQPERKDAHVSYDSPRRWEERPATVLSYRAYSDDDGTLLDPHPHEDEYVRREILRAWKAEQASINRAIDERMLV